MKSVPEMDGMVFVGVLCDDKNVLNQGGPVNSSIEVRERSSYRILIVTVMCFMTESNSSVIHRQRTSVNEDRE